MMLSPFSEIVGLIFLVSKAITAHIIPNPVLSDMFDPSVVAILIAAGVGLASNIFYDWIKKRIIKEEGKKRTYITQIKKPDGTYLLTVDIDEDMSPEDADRIAKRITDTSERLDSPISDQSSQNENNLQ